MGQEVTFDQHPALKNFNRTAFMARHVVKTMLKWGAIGAIIGAVAAVAMGGAIAVGMGGIISGLTVLAGYFIPAVANVGKEIAVSTTTTSALVAGAGAGLIGAVVAATGAGDAANAEEDRLVAKYEQMENRRGRMAALAKRRDEQRYAMEKQELAMRRPNLEIPQGKQAQSAGLAQV